MARKCSLCRQEGHQRGQCSNSPFGGAWEPSIKPTDDTPAQTRTFEVTIPCPHCRRLLDVFLKEAS